MYIYKKKGNFLAKKKNNFINNAEFFEAICKWQDSVIEARNNQQEDPQIPNIIGKVLLLLCTRLGDRPNFINYSYKDIMISDAIMACLTALHKFDRNRTQNPFGFFTQVAWYAFINRINSEKLEQYVKHKNFENVYHNEFMSSKTGDNSFDLSGHYKIIDEFEHKKLKKE